jgi:lipid II:glycine glycyltransferase (peptidoglycan interpeptide bridge formation enzyme)
MASREPSVPGPYLKSLVPVEISRCDEARSFLQSGFWGSFKARFGWSARTFRAEWAWGEAGAASLPLLVMRRPLALGVSFAYVPWGPELPLPQGSQDRAGYDSRNQALAELAQGLRSFLPSNTAFIRFDPPWYTEGADVAPPPVGKPFSRAGVDVQPPDTVILDLTLSEEDLLKQMKPKWRYNIGLAERKGVTVRCSGGEALDLFYTLFQETAKRDGIAIHSRDYYAGLFELCGEYASAGGTEATGPEARLYIAEHEGEAIAAVITLFRDQDGTYLYGASSDKKRNLMAPYLLQWTAMQDAKARGCTRYDLFGIPPNDDPAHPMAGLYRFKTGFGGRIIHRPGSWDYVYRPLVRRLFTAAECVRKMIRDLKK